MRLCFTSDLHVEQNPAAARLVAERARALGADALVVAGDLASRDDARERALFELAAGAKVVAFVPGNHDLWCAGGDVADSRARYLLDLPEACARAGVAYLPAGPVEVGGVTLVGQTGWYDYSMRDPALAAAVPPSAYASGRFGRLAWSDKVFVRWPGLDDAGLTEWMTARLAADLAAAPKDRPAVVVTHVLPFEALAPRRPLPWGFVRAFLGARALGEAIVAASADGLEVAMCIAGHTHFARRASVRAGRGLVHAVTSPLGYPREHKRMGFADVAALVAHRVRVVEVAAPAHARRRGAAA